MDEMQSKKLPKRSEVPEAFTWDLSGLFTDDEAWQAEYEALQTAGDELAAFAGTLGRSAEDLLLFLKKEDEIDVRLEKLYNYANLRSDQDTGNGFYAGMRSRAMNTLVGVSGAMAFASPEIMAISEDTLNLFYTAQPALEEYRRSLYRIRRRAAHILSPAEEKLLAAAGEMADSPDNIGGVFRNADLKFPDAADAEGKLHPVTSGSFVPLLQESDRTLRENAFRSCYKTYGQFKNTAAAILDAQFKQLCFFANARRYSGTLEAALDANEVPVEVYTNLIEAVHANLEPMYRYVALRKRMLGVDELHMYDVYVPIVADAAVRIPYEEAKETVLEALSVMGKDYTDLLRKGFADRWIDVYENEGKRSGAYSSGTSRPHPYVLLNHHDTLDDMFTIAHEMGHALHSWHSTENQPVSTSEYVIFVAEVASTCNEVLLMRYLLNRTTDRKERAYLINHFLDAFKGTVYRQTMFAEFELAMGRRAEQGEALTADALNEIYGGLNKLYFGPDMVSDEEISLEWARIPHFFYNYYVYQYATGYSAAVALADRILREGAPAVEDYKRFLSGGCSTDPISLLKIAGVDMSTPQPVNAALRLFDELVSELEKLLEE